MQVQFLNGVNGIPLQFLNGNKVYMPQEFNNAYKKIQAQANRADNMRSNVIQHYTKGIDNKLKREIDSVVAGVDIENFLGDGSEDDSQKIYNYLVRTKNIVDKAPNLIEKGQQQLSNLLGHLIKNWNTANRGKAILECAKAEEELTNRGVFKAEDTDKHYIELGEVYDDDLHYLNFDGTIETKLSKRGLFNRIKQASTAPIKEADREIVLDPIFKRKTQGNSDEQRELKMGADFNYDVINGCSVNDNVANYVAYFTKLRNDIASNPSQYFYSHDVAKQALSFLDNLTNSLTDFNKLDNLFLAYKNGIGSVSGVELAGLNGKLKKALKKVGQKAKAAVKKVAQTTAKVVKTAAKATANVAKATAKVTAAAVVPTKKNIQKATSAVKTAAKSTANAVKTATKSTANVVKTTVKATVVNPTKTIVKATVVNPIKTTIKLTKKITKKVVAITKKMVKLIWKYNPLTLLIRAGLLVAFKFNMFQMSRRAYAGCLSANEAEKIGVTGDDYERAKQSYEQIAKIFKGLGGREDKLQANLKKGFMRKWNGSTEYSQSEIQKAAKNIDTNFSSEMKDIDADYNADIKELKNKGAEVDNTMNPESAPKQVSQNVTVVTNEKTTNKATAMYEQGATSAKKVADISKGVKVFVDQSNTDGTWIAATDMQGRSGYIQISALSGIDDNDYNSNMVAVVGSMVDNNLIQINGLGEAVTAAASTAAAAGFIAKITTAFKKIWNFGKKVVTKSNVVDNMIDKVVDNQPQQAQEPEPQEIIDNKTNYILPQATPIFQSQVQPQAQAQGKSNKMWWIIGGVALLGIGSIALINNKR